MIAMAVASEPQVLIADEPTTALDVTVQADILDLLDELRWRTGMGMLLISHDLSVVAERCESISVMRQGAIVESGPSGTVISSPRHPFTADLVRDLADPPETKDWPAHPSSARPANDPGPEADG
jgi:ABC-type dipeptide/oligopeptide/nickel transport system ATPase component